MEQTGDGTDRKLNRPKMEQTEMGQTESSETLACKIQTPGNHTEESIKRVFLDCKFAKNVNSSYLDIST
jgi:hypothetical protein